MSIQQDPVIIQITKDLVERHSDNLIAIYGIGSYFDDLLPENWKINDLDIIIIVKSIEEIPKKDWYKRFNTQNILGHEVWFGYNTIELYNNRKEFNDISGANYEWALIEIKHPENSVLLFGEDIRDQIPDTTHIEFDYDDILARVFYHLEKSLKEEVTNKAKTEYTKAVFKLAYYLCVFFDNTFRYTSHIKVGEKLQEIAKNNSSFEIMARFYEEVMIFRITGIFKTELSDLRTTTITSLISLIGQGKLHRPMDFEELIKYLSKFFKGFPLLRKEAINMYLDKKIF